MEQVEAVEEELMELLVQELLLQVVILLTSHQSEVILVLPVAPMVVVPVVLVVD
jgi:hypothetical protein